jgi:hypothetical protein
MTLFHERQIYAQNPISSTKNDCILYPAWVTIATGKHPKSDKLAKPPPRLSHAAAVFYA